MNWTEITHRDWISSRWSSTALHDNFLCYAPQQSLAKLPADKSRSKKTKEPKPRVKKLKYHQYIPPDQKQELSEVPMDASYARLLQQQQQFLQLQILSQQQQYNYQSVQPATLKYGNSHQHKLSLMTDIFSCQPWCEDDSYFETLLPAYWNQATFLIHRVQSHLS